MLTCAFGVDWALHFPGPCLWCAAESARRTESFQAAVRAGTYDAAGYTAMDRWTVGRAPAPRRARQEGRVSR